MPVCPVSYGCAPCGPVGGSYICTPVPCLAVICGAVGPVAVPLPPVGRFRGLWAIRTGRGGHLCPCALFGRPVAVRHIVAGGGTRAPCWPVPVGLSSVGWFACSCSGLPVPPVGRFRGLWAVRTGRGGYLCPCALFGRPVAVILHLRLSF